MAHDLRGCPCCHPANRRGNPRRDPGCARIPALGPAATLGGRCRFRQPQPSPSSLWKEHPMSTLPPRPAPAGRAPSHRRSSDLPHRPPRRRRGRTEGAARALGIPVLRVALGAVFVAFGIPEVLPGREPGRVARRGDVGRAHVRHRRRPAGARAHRGHRDRRRARSSSRVATPGSVSWSSRSRSSASSRRWCSSRASCSPPAGRRCSASTC